MTQDRVHKGIPTGGEFAAHNRSEAAVTLDRPHAGRGVSDIDHELAGYYSDMFPYKVKIWKDEDFLVQAERFRVNPKAFRYDSWKFRDLDERIAEAEARIEKNSAIVDKIRVEQVQPLNAEFDARGGWTRFYLVTSSGGGHVHRDMSCSTCFPRTQYVWLTDESGKSEDEIVEQAGDGACTVCYPTAPVADRNNPRPNPFEDPAVKAARDARNAEKAVRDAEKAAKAITTPSGEPLIGSEGSTLKTERAAEIDALHGLGNIGFYGRSHPTAETWVDASARIQIALAAKRGITVEEVAETWKAKLKGKAKRDMLNYTQTAQMYAALEDVNKLVKEWDKP